MFFSVPYQYCMGPCCNAQEKLATQALRAYLCFTLDTWEQRGCVYQKILKWNLKKWGYTSCLEDTIRVSITLKAEASPFPPAPLCLQHQTQPPYNYDLPRAINEKLFKNGSGWILGHADLQGLRTEAPGCKTACTVWLCDDFATFLFFSFLFFS